MKKKFLALCMALAAVMATTAGSFAVDSTMSDVTTALGTGFTDIATQAMNVIAVIVPIALGIVAAVFVIRKAIGWFKSLAK